MCTYLLRFVYQIEVSSWWLLVVMELTLLYLKITKPSVNFIQRFVFLIFYDVENLTYKSLNTVEMWYCGIKTTCFAYF